MKKSKIADPYAGSVLSREVVKTRGGFPAKLYVFRSTKNTYSDALRPGNYLLQLLNDFPEIKEKPRLYSIAFAWGYYPSRIWGESPVRAMDIHSYAFDKPWNECDPIVDSNVFKNFNRAEEGKVSRETSIIILGKEGELRRKCKNLYDYLQEWPNLGRLGPVNKS